ncbi:transcription antiterminator [Listeria monocytogenes]|uniref:BglG family transcription antiterminator n=1 Tax=Listeria monocytogenes TaxID=1639 RepID=UPI0018371D68|nr:transcription antiterminator [Listeria monocytogenes]
MTISERQRSLLEKLNDSQKTVTAKALSEMLGVSSKTVRNDIMQINQSFSSTIIASKAGKGYFLTPNEQLSQINLTKNSENLHFELLRHIIEQDHTNFYDLADQFFISESTLARIIKELNAVIAEKDTSLCIIRKNNELLTEGGEEEKRRIFNLFLNQEIENHQLSLDKYADYFDYCNLKQLSELIIAYHKKNDFFMNDFSTISFILHIAVLIERISMGSYIERTALLEQDKTSLEMAEHLAETLENELQINIPTQELSYIARLYSGKLTTTSTIDAQVFGSVVTRLLEAVDQNFHIDFSADEKIATYLVAHISALYKRANHKQYLTNPLTEELKNKFPFIYNVSVYASAFIQKELAITFPDDEIAYIALHFLSASETINHGKKRKILLVSPYGAGSQRLIHNQLKKIADFSIDLLVSQSIFDIKQFTLDKEIHLIITAEPLNLTTDIPVYHYDLLLTETDLQKIKHILETKPKTDSISRKFFKKELFFPKQNFKSKEEVITFLCEQLTAFDYCDSDYVSKVFEREQLSSTCYGNYYAIPHAIQRSAKKNAVAVCALDKPIDWGGNRVKLVLLLTMKEERDNSFEELFGQLVTILNERSFVKKLAKQEDFQQFIELCEQKTLDS